MFKAFSALLATTTLALALDLGSATALAQEGRTNDRTVATTPDTRHDDRGFDYGWLGLVGLIGLLGLLPRDRGITVRDGAGNVKDSGRR